MYTIKLNDKPVGPPPPPTLLLCVNFFVLLFWFHLKIVCNITLFSSTAAEYTACSIRSPVSDIALIFLLLKKVFKIPMTNWSLSILI